MILISINSAWSGLIIIREFMKMIFNHDKGVGRKVTPQPLTKPIPAFESPLKDSYSNSSNLLKENVKLAWSSPSVVLKSPLKISTPSPKLSERVTSPLATTSITSPLNLMSPSKGVGIGSTWSAALDEQLNKPSLTSKADNNASTKENGRESISGLQSGKGDASTGVGKTRPAKIILDREVLSPESSLQYCNLSSDLENYIENVRRWFTRKIINPLSSEIAKVDSALESSGLSHLTSRCPANYSMAAKTMDAELMSTHLFLTAPTGFNETRIQTLNDLERSRPNDPIVQSRLKIEKYLSIALISTHRVSLIKRISNLADGTFLNSFHTFNNLNTETSRTDPFDDAQILLHLFCTFLNDKLPSENANDPCPFTSTFFVSSEEKMSNRPDAIQLQQTSSNPINLRVIAEDKILQSHPGHDNLFEAILLLVDYVHRNLRGYLGIGNLDSVNIDLISILRK